RSQLAKRAQSMPRSSPRRCSEISIRVFARLMIGSAEVRPNACWPIDGHPRNKTSFNCTTKSPVSFETGLYARTELNGVTRTGLAAGRLILDLIDRIGAVRRARRFLTDIQVRTEQFRIRGRVAVHFLLFEGPGVLGAIDLLEVRDASVLLAELAGLDEVRNRNRGQQTDNRDHDHDFHQCERAAARCL